MGKYDDLIGGFKVTIDVEEVLNEEAAKKVDDRIKKQKEELSQPIEINVKSNKAENQLKALHKAAQKVKDDLQDAISNQKGFEEVNKLVTKYGHLKKQIGDIAPVVGKNNATFKESNKILKDTKKLVDQLTVSQDKLNKTSGKTRTSKVNTIGSPKEIEQAFDAVEDKIKDVKDTYETFSEIVEKTKRSILGTDFDDIFHTRTVEGYAASLEKVRGKMSEIKDAARDARQEYEDIVNTMASYTGIQLGGKSDFQKAIKDAWKQGDHAMAAKLFDSYQKRFPKGAFKPENAFGAEWSNNFDKNLTEANARLALHRTQLQRTAEAYGTYSALMSLQGMERQLTDGYNRMLQERAEAEKAAAEQANMLADAQKRFATNDVVTAQKNLNAAIDEYNAKLAESNRLLEEKRRIEDLDSYENEPWFNDYELPVNKIMEISQQFAAAEDAVNLFKIALKEAVRVYRELGGDMKLPFGADLLKEIDIPVRVAPVIDAQIKTPKIDTVDEDELEIIQKENGALEDKLELLQDIAEQYGNNVSQRDRNRYEELNQKDMNDGLTSREEERYWELGEAIDDADRQIEEFGQTYSRVILKLANGQKVEILPDDAGLKKFDKIASEYYQGEYNGIEIEDVIFERITNVTAALEEQAIATEQLAAARLASSNDLVTKTNILAEFTQLSGQLAFQHVGTEQYDAIIGKIEEISNGILNTGMSLEDANKQLNEFIDGLKQAVQPSNKLTSSYEGLAEAVEQTVDAQEKLNNATVKYVPIMPEGRENIWGDTDDITIARNYIHNQDRGFNVGTRLSVVGAEEIQNAKELDEITRRYNESRQQTQDILNQEKLTFENIVYLLKEYNQMYWSKLSNPNLAADAVNLEADIENKLGAHTSFSWDNYLNTLWHNLEDPNRNDAAFDAYAKAIAKHFGVEIPNAANEAIASIEKQAASVENIVKLVDNYGTELDEVNNKLMQGTTLLNEQAQVLRLFHNSSEVFDQFDITKAGSNQGQALGIGNYLALRQDGEFNDLTYGRYQTQWYANVQNAFNVRDRLTDTQSAAVIDKFMADRAEGFKQHMLSKLLDGDIVTAIKDIAEISKTNVGEIFGYLGYDAIIDGAQVNVFDPSKIYRANDSVLDIGTGEFDAFRELQKNIWAEHRVIENANKQIEKLSNQYSGKTKEELDSALFAETLIRAWNWRDNVAKIASALKELTGELPTVDGISEESMRAMVENYEFSKQDLQGYIDEKANHVKILNQLETQFFAQEQKIHDITQSYLTGNISGVVNQEVQPQIAQQTALQIEAQADAEQKVAEATAETTANLKEQQEVVEEIAKTESKLGKQAFRGLGLDEFFKNWKIPDKDRKPIKQELYKLAEMYSADKITSEVDAQHIEQYPEQYNKVVNMLLDSLQANKAQREEYKEFLNWMSGQNVAYDPNDREYAAAFDKAWGTIRQKHSSWLVSSEKNTTASGPDTFFESIPEHFLHLFNEQDYNLTNTYDILRALVDVIDTARTEQTMMDVEGLEQTKMSLAEHFATDLFLPMIDKVDTIIDTSEDEAIRIIQKTVDQALKQLRNAQNNQNAMIDLSAVSSPGDLEEQIGGLVTKSLNADLTVGAVKIKDNIAQISLYNKELGLTQQQTWALERSTEDAMEAQLKFIKADPLEVNFEQAAKYAEAQQKKIEDSTKWLISAQKKLDTQKRDYQHSQKKIDGSTTLLNMDATTLEKDVDGTIDELVEHIQQRINNSVGKLTTSELKNQITKDLNALENEIKIRQLEKYTSTTMSASEAEAARKVIVDTIDTIAVNAKKKNVFDSIRESYESLRARLTDSSVKGYIDSNFTDAINEMRVLRADSSKASAEESNLEKILSLQERLYEAKKKVADLEAKDRLYESDGMKASRKLADLQAEYDTSVKLLENEKQREAVRQREAQLEAELNKFNLEQENIKRQEVEAEQASSVKSQYQTILDLVNKINTANERMIKFQSMDGGSGVLKQQMQAEVAKRAEAVEKLQTVMSELNIGNVLGKDQYSVPDDIKSIGADYSQISAFINDAGVQAALTTTEIDKLVNALVKAGDIDLSMLDETLKFGNLKEQAKQIQKENLFFSDKTSITDTENIKLGINDIQKLGEAGSTTKEKLESLAQAIAQNSNGAVALTKSFTQGVDGIARLDFSVFDTQTNSMRDFTAAMGTATQQFGVYETTVSKSLANISAAQKQLQSSGNLISILGNSGVATDDGASAKVRELLSLYNQLATEMAKGDNADQTQITKLTKDLKLATGETDKLYKQMLQLDDAIASGQVKDLGKGDADGNVYNQLVDATKNLVGANQNATVECGRFDAATNTLNASLVHANGTVENFKVSMNGLNGQMTAQQSGVSKLTSTWDRFKASLGQAGKQLMTAFVGYNVFYKAISEVRKGVGYVKEIDLALTELKKVTDETEASYAKFLKTAPSTAGKIGSTVSDFTEATSNFARLGYTMEESANMAETAIVYRNVADGLDTVEEATDSIISTMKAFGIESNNTMGIVDRFNEVGNNFAITSAGIGEALQRSASALYAGGNTIDESIALVTAANSVIQNPEQVGG